MLHLIKYHFAMGKT